MDETGSRARDKACLGLVLCLGELMIVLDTTIVGVALPSIREDLRFTEATLVWVVNAYMLTYGGFLLLGGRLGDLYGQRRLFVGGTLFFTAASLVCGSATTQWLLVAARFAQGLGGVFLALSTALLYLVTPTYGVIFPILGFAIALLVAVLAFVNLAFGYCLGCQIYYQLGKRGLIRA